MTTNKSGALFINEHLPEKFFFSPDIYLLKVNNRNTEAKCEICSKLIIKTTRRRHLYC